MRRRMCFVSSIEGRTAGNVHGCAFGFSCMIGVNIINSSPINKNAPNLNNTPQKKRLFARVMHFKAVLFLCMTLLFLLQICDKEWHYYVINVEFPAVTLFVDGVTYEPYLVTDDWPIHTSKIDTQLTVGACWQGQFVYLCLKIYSSFSFMQKCIQGIEAEMRQG